MEKRTEHAKFDRLEFSKECLTTRVVIRRKVDYERLGVHSSSLLSCMHNKNDAYVQANIRKNGHGCNKTDDGYDSLELRLVSRGEETLRPAEAC